MRTVEDVGRHVRGPAVAIVRPSRAPARDTILAELGSGLFASLRRADQRRKGMEYVRGLLEAEGRKSIRNIAIQLGTPAAEQRLHHFISDSTWDWEPLRRALVDHLVRTAPPQAWVVRPTVIPKAGEHSVGVGRQFSPDAGAAMNAQLAVGLWAASEEMTAPVDWRLYLTPAWLDDLGRRRRASIPDEVTPESLGDCIAEAFLDSPVRREMPMLPVVLDGRSTDVRRTVRRLRLSGVPVLVRIDRAHPLVVDDPRLPGHSTEPLFAHQIMSAARRLRRPASVRSADDRSGNRMYLAAAVRVRGAGPTTRRAPGAMRLLGVGEASRRWPSELWLADMPDAPDLPAPVLARLATLVGRVEQDVDEVGEQVGLRDFAGRSFTGWHRHVTLASAAHTVVAQARMTRTATDAARRRPA